MKPDEPPPLWLESIPDREPWRRGRDAVAFLSTFILLGQGAFVAWTILLGNLIVFLCASVVGLAALALFYFIWIGHHWPRWVLAPLYLCSGFVNVIWSVMHGNGLLFLLGLAGLTIFFYLALAPSVYAFARHQRECIRPAERAIVGAIFFLMIASVGCGLYGLYVYDNDLQREATQFAVTTFKKVFVYHDEEFLQANLKNEARATTPHDFVAKVEDTFGPVRPIGEFRGLFASHWAQRRLRVSGIFEVEVQPAQGLPIWVNLAVSPIGDGWQIDRLGWEYHPVYFGARR